MSRLKIVLIFHHTGGGGSGVGPIYLTKVVGFVKRVRTGKHTSRSYSRKSGGLLGNSFEESEIDEIP